MKVKLENVRLAFPALFEAKAVNGEGTPRFSAVLIVEPGSANAKAIKAAVLAVAKEKWQGKAEAILKTLYATDKVAYKETPKTNQSGDVYDGFEGMHSLNANSKTRPLVIDRDKTPLTAADGRPYAGCYVNCSVEFWPQDNSYGKRINAQLRGVQFLRDGDAFAGGSPASEDEFGDVTEGAEAEALV